MTPALHVKCVMKMPGRGQVQPDQPFIGFGDPLLSEGKGKKRGQSLAQLFSRGGVAEVDNVLALPCLPDTANKLMATSKLFKAEPDSLHLRERDMEQRDLSRYRVISFATHGLLAGDIKGVAESALVFTPPKVGTTDDDGLLTASEVALLKLNADWVVMSACNTAGPRSSNRIAIKPTGNSISAIFAGRTVTVTHCKPHASRIDHDNILR